MSLQELQDQVFQLPLSDRLALVSLIIESVQVELSDDLPQTQLSYIPGSSIRGHLRAEIDRMRGFLKTDKPVPTDSEVQTILEERLVEKYL